MILVDTSVWIDHLRASDSRLRSLLLSSKALGHPWVVGEIALGHLSRRDEILGLLKNLPQATLATHDEVMSLLEGRRLFELGIGYVDAHLLTATLLTSGATLWTRDRRLLAAAEQLGIATETH
jgi:predicted nucleic acid-binding protein